MIWLNPGHLSGQVGTGIEGRRTGHEGAWLTFGISAAVQAG